MDKFKNQLICQQVFKLKPNKTNIYNPQNRIIIKDFKYQVLNDDKKKQQLNDLNTVYHHMPISSYDESLTDFENLEIFSQTHSDAWLDLPPSQKLYTAQYLTNSTGCQHYVRTCEIECFTCKLYFPCRFCHNDASDHDFDRFRTEHFRCMQCGHVQFPSKKCENCSVEFGEYFCDKCRLVCDIGSEAKLMFHCEGCNCCIVGIQQYTQHCDVCRVCYSKAGFAEHRCGEIGNCIVCLDGLRHSIYGHIELKCGHLIHDHCYEELIDLDNFKCPVCKKFMPQGSDAKQLIQQFKKVFRRVFMYPEEQFIKCQCNDCGVKFISKKHPFMQYCWQCDNFNVDELENDGGQIEFNEYLQKCKVKPLQYNLESAVRFLNVLKGNQVEGNVEYFSKQVGVPMNEVTSFMVANLATRKVYYKLNVFIKDFKKSFLDFLLMRNLEETFEAEEE